MIGHKNRMRFLCPPPLSPHPSASLTDPPHTPLLKPPKPPDPLPLQPAQAHGLHSYAPAAALAALIQALTPLS